MADGVYAHRGGAKSAYQVIWQALTDAMYFYERHSSTGALQAADALRALEYLQSLAESPQSAVERTGGRPHHTPEPRRAIHPPSAGRYRMWPAQRRAG